ncbi:MAG: tRNA dimethylallyltransferase [Chthoniobacter sp.]|jgi:tRNA dimethylallyltransferase|nr:tRNA dimethylallyltransferase [Chthoniobacter sp.]
MGLLLFLDPTPRRCWGKSSHDAPGALFDQDVSSEAILPFFVIAGPTGVGKSDLAVQIAERCRGEIIGADAFQVYEGLDLLTAKPSPALRARVPHHLVGEVPLAQPYDVAQFVAAARRRIAEIHARGNQAIVCGGTGLYLRALTRGLADLPPANAELRSRLESQSLEDLQSRLAELDPLAARTIDLKNPRRVIRALEVCLVTGQPFSSFRDQWHAQNTVRGVVVIRDRADLYRRIDQRTLEMFAAGVEGEVRTLGEVGTTASQVIGLREIRALLAGQIPRSDCIAAIQQATRRYARRQLTWFRQERTLETIDLSSVADPAAVICKHLSTPRPAEFDGCNG